MQLEAGGIGRVIALPMASADLRPKAIGPPRPRPLSQSAESDRPAAASRTIAFVLEPADRALSLGRPMVRSTYGDEAQVRDAAVLAPKPAGEQPSGAPEAGVGRIEAAAHARAGALRQAGSGAGQTPRASRPAREDVPLVVEIHGDGRSS